MHIDVNIFESKYLEGKYMVKEIKKTIRKNYGHWFHEQIPSNIQIQTNSWDQRPVTCLKSTVKKTEQLP